VIEIAIGDRSGLDTVRYRVHVRKVGWGTSGFQTPARRKQSHYENKNAAE